MQDICIRYRRIFITFHIINFGEIFFHWILEHILLSACLLAFLIVLSKRVKSGSWQNYCHRNCHTFCSRSCLAAVIEKINVGLHMQQRLSAVCNTTLYARILDSLCTELVHYACEASILLCGDEVSTS